MHAYTVGAGRTYDLLDNDDHNDDNRHPSCASGFNSLPSHLPSVQAGERRLFHAVQILAPLNLLVANRQDDLYVAWMSLVGVNAAVGSIRPSTGFLTENKKSMDWSAADLNSIDIRELVEQQCS